MIDAELRADERAAIVAVCGFGVHSMTKGIWLVRMKALPIPLKAASVSSSQLSVAKHIASIEDHAEVMEVTYPLDADEGPVAELASPSDILIGAVERDTNVIIPRGNTVIRPGDHLLLVTFHDNVEKVEGWLEGRRRAAKA